MGWLATLVTKAFVSNRGSDRPGRGLLGRGQGLRVGAGEPPERVVAKVDVVDPMLDILVVDEVKTDDPDAWLGLPRTCVRPPVVHSGDGLALGNAEGLAHPSGDRSTERQSPLISGTGELALGTKEGQVDARVSLHSAGLHSTQALDVHQPIDVRSGQAIVREELIQVALRPQLDEPGTISNSTHVHSMPCLSQRRRAMNVRPRGG